MRCGINELHTSSRLQSYRVETIRGRKATERSRDQTVRNREGPAWTEHGNLTVRSSQ